MTMMPQDFVSAEMMEDFVSASYEKLNILEECLSQQSQSAFAVFLREAHSLKGNAQTYGFKDLADLCHRMEDTLVAGEWSDASRAHLGVYLAHLDVALSQLKAS